MGKSEEIRQYCNLIAFQVDTLCKLEDQFMGTETAGMNITDSLYSLVSTLDEAVTKFADLISEVGA